MRYSRGSPAGSRAYLLGLLSRTERKSGWTIAELAGDGTSDGMREAAERLLLVG